MTVSSAYGPLGLSLFGGEVNYEADVIKAMLLTSSYVVNQDTHRYVADVSAAELSGAGYTAGGLQVTSKTVTYDAANNRVKLTCDNLQWTGTTWLDVKYLVFYDADSGALLCYVDFETVQSTNNSPFTYLVPADGILTMTIV